MFLLDLIVALIQGSVRSATRLRYIDGLILLRFCSGYIFGRFSVWGHRTIKHVRRGGSGQVLAACGGLGTYFRLLLCAVISVYGGLVLELWGNVRLVAAERRKGKQTRRMLPAAHVCFFGEVDVYASGGIRYYYIVITVACAAYYCTMLALPVVQSVAML